MFVNLKSLKMKHKLLLLFLAATLVSNTFAQQEWTLDTCINYALKNNLNLLKQDLTVAILRNNFKITKYNRLPSVNASISGGTTFGQSFSQDKGGFIDEQVTSLNGDLSANVALFEGFRNVHAINQKSKETEAAIADKDAYANDMALLIVNYYLQILYNKEQKNVSSTQLKATQKQIERTKQLYNAGSVPKGNLLELRAQAANEKSQIISFLNMEKEARVNLKQAMNVQTDSLIIATPDEIDAEKLYATLPLLNTIYNTAIQHLPEVKAAQARIKSNAEAIEIAKADYYPSLYLGGSVSTRYSDAAINPKKPLDDYKFGSQINDFRYANIGLTLSIPIFNKFRTKYNVDNATISYEMSKYDESLTLQNIYKQIETASNDARAAYENFKAAKESLSANTEAFNYAEERFNAGVIHSVDYNLAKTNLAKAQVGLLNARYELIFKVKVLDFYMGKDFNI